MSLSFRRQYTGPLPGDSPVVSCDPSQVVTEQHHRDEVDISVMLARFGIGADQRLPVVTISDIVKDVSVLPENLQEAYDILENARLQFSRLPSGVRSYFRNDPRRFAMASEDDLLASGIPGKPSSPAVKPEVVTDSEVASSADAES